MKKNSLKALYYFSLFTWIGTICLVVLSLIFEFSKLWIVGSFLCSFVQGLLLCKHDDGRPWKWTDAYSPFDRCLRGLVCVFFITFILCFASLSIAGGGPEIRNGIRCVVDHGKIVAENISKEWFLYLTICETVFFFVSEPLFLTTYVLWRIHMLYLTGEPKDEKECTDHR